MMKIANNNGFTMMELMMSMAIFAVVVIAAGQTYVLFQEYWHDASRVVSCQSRGRVFLNEVGRTIRNASDVTVSNGSTTSVMQIDTIDGATVEYAYDLNDQTITYDSDTSALGGPVDVMHNVFEIAEQPVFQRQGAENVVINFRVMDPDTSDNDGYQGSDFSLTTYWRN